LIRQSFYEAAEHGSLIIKEAFSFCPLSIASFCSLGFIRGDTVMRHSIYLSIAIWFIRADLRQEERAWKRKIRRSAYDIPWDNPHLLQDIGLEADGSPIDRNEIMDKEKRLTCRARRIRRLMLRRITT
jgi:hypothetical protein